MPQLQFDHVTKSYGDVVALRDVSFEARDGELLVLVGPSGCGKSTTLRLIAGLEEFESGTISIDGNAINNLPPKDRDIAMVFQNYALYPHMTVRQNLGFGLKMKKTPTDEIDQRVLATAQSLDIEDLLERKPGQLSGGQKQRVAVGRAMIRKPAVFLFDEPLSNLDAKLRVTLRDEMASLHQRLSATIIYVTHDQIEALTLGNRIAVMNEGQIQQIGTPQQIYQTPANTFVASFIGNPAMNLISPALLQIESTADCLGIRPEDFSLGDKNSSGVEAIVTGIQNTGADCFLSVQVASKTLTVRTVSTTTLAIGDSIYLQADLAAVHFFDTTGNRITE